MSTWFHLLPPDHPAKIAERNERNIATLAASARRRAQRRAAVQPASLGAIPSASTLNQQPSLAEVQRAAPASGRPIPLLYGPFQTGGEFYNATEEDGLWTACYLIGLGEVNSIDQVWINDGAPKEGVIINTYLGTTSQGIDPLMATAFPGYDETHVIARDGQSFGVAYVVLQYTNDQYAGWPKILVQGTGRKVYDAVADVVQYSDCPSLHLADLCSSTFYGAGDPVDRDSLIAAQTYNQDTAPGEVRRQSGFVIKSVRNTQDWIETLRAYAGVFIVRRGDTLHFVPDKLASSVRSFTKEDIVADTIETENPDPEELPTVMRISYSDTSGNAWRERYCEPVERPEVAAGTMQRRESRIPMPWITRHSQAKREATERLNKLHLRDFTIRFITRDEAIALELGDIIDVTHESYGLIAKLFRIDRDPEQVSPGRWQIHAAEYDPAVYSDEVATQPSYSDGNLPSDAPPDAVTGLVVGESTYQLQNGKWASRLDISWTASSNIFVTGYDVKVTDNLGAVVYAVTTSESRISTGPLLELVPYTIEVVPTTPLQRGDAATDNWTIIGKTAIPAAPASINGFEAGGEVRLTWPKSTDVDAERYEIRYGPVGGSWETATSLNIVDGLSLDTKNVPEGTWRFYVRTIDSIQQYSTDEATVDLEVTLDNDAFTAASLIPLGEGTPSTTLLMHESFEKRGDEWATWYTDGGDSWASLFGGAAMSAFGNALGSYQTIASEARWVSEEIDLVSVKSGNLAVSPPTFLYGSPDVQLYTEADGWATTQSIQFTAQFARTRFSDTSNTPFAFYEGEGSLRVDIVAREETGSEISDATVGVGKKISLSRQYAAARSIVITPLGSGALIPTVDAVVLNDGGVTSFEVFIRNENGAQVANAFLWAWKGV